VDLITRFASANGTTPAQIALAWLLATKPWIVPIPGTTKLDRLVENVNAANVVLSSADVEALDRASAAIPLKGDRYSGFQQSLVNR
jgi:aryl-alcohol dehydrogenase-like predicted oxidoreductase